MPKHNNPDRKYNLVATFHGAHDNDDTYTGTRPDLLHQIKQEAERTGQSVETVAATVLREHVPVAAPDRDDIGPTSTEVHQRLREVLQAADLRTELGPELQKRAEISTATLEDVQAAFARAGVGPLSEIVLEQRGPKE